MAILRNLVSVEARASENAEVSSGETEIPVGADIVVAAECQAGREAQKIRITQLLAVEFSTRSEVPGKPCRPIGADHAPVVIPGF